jgi:hypothetical protein
VSSFIVAACGVAYATAISERAKPEGKKEEST